MKKILKKGKRGNKKNWWLCEEMPNLGDSSTRIELIQMLIPLGLQAVEEEL